MTTTPSDRTRVLIADADDATSRIIANHLTGFGYEVCGIVDSVTAAIEAADDWQPALLLMDVTLTDGEDGILAAKSIYERHSIPVVFVTARYDDETFTRALDISPIGYLIKPFRPEDLKATLDLALHRHRTETQDRIDLTELALTDPVTGLANRRGLERLLERMWGDAANKRTAIAILMIDIDNFKSINDTYGHTAGDACLNRAGTLFRKLCGRGGDTVGRWGGDEFLAIVPGITADGLTFIAESMVRLTRESSTSSPHPPHTISVGGAIELTPKPTASWRDLVETADRRLYAAKLRGKDRSNCGDAMESVHNRNEPRADAPLQTLPLSPSLHDQLQLMRKQLNRIAPIVDQISFATYTRATGRLTMAIQATDDGGLLSDYSAVLADVPSLTNLIATRSARVIHDLRKETSRHTPHSQLLQLMQYRSSYTVPIFVHGDFIGFLFFDSQNPRAFTDEILARIAVQINMIQMLICQEVFAVRALHGTAHAVSHVAHYRDAETGSHLQRMARYAKVIAAELAAQQSLPDDFVDLTFLFAPFHDIGKLGVANSVLQKPDVLNDSEKAMMATHVDLGARIVEMLIDEFELGQFSGIRMLRNIVTAHHEFLDGSGYPRKLQGNEIPLEARIVTVADIFDALTSSRPYKKAWDADLAYDKLREMAADGKLDTACVAALEEHRFSVQQIAERFDSSIPPSTSPDQGTP
jgi:diguanylate cyclase (GGDEF)-like protein